MQGNRVLIFGSGRICAILKRCAHTYGYDCDVIALRNLKDVLPHANFKLYAQFIYLGYDHFSLYRNFKYMSYVIKAIRDANCKQPIVFLNTQGVLLNILARDSLPAYDSVVPDRYILAKRIQSRLLHKSGLRYIEYFLPLVVGDDTAQDEQLRKIAHSPGIEFPMRGGNHFYFLRLEALARQIFNLKYCNEGACNESAFLYSDYSTLYNKLKNHFSEDFVPVDIRYNNAYNLPKLQLFEYLVVKFLKAIAGILFYSFRGGVLKERQDDVSVSLEYADPEMCRFFSLDFLPPERIRAIRIHKI